MAPTKFAILKKAHAFAEIWTWDPNHYPECSCTLDRSAMAPYKIIKYFSDETYAHTCWLYLTASLGVI